MRWYLENSAAGRFWIAEFSGGGELRVSQGPCGSPADSTEELSFETQDAAVDHATKLTIETVQDGFAWRLHPDDRYAADPVVLRYFRDEWPRELATRYDVTPRESRGLAERLAEYHAAQLPPELERFLTFVDTHGFGYTNFGEWRLWDSDFGVVDSENGNLFEQLVVMDQNNYLGTAMMEYFVGCIFVGSLGNGDAYFACPNFMDPDHAEVAFWNHESGTLEAAFCDSIATLAWVNHLYVSMGDDDFESSKLVEGMQRIAERASLSWHFGDQQDESEIYPEYKDIGRQRYYYWRSVWIMYLLRQNGVVEVEDIGEYFFQDFHTSLKFEDATKHPFLKESPITGLYWLWRLWWFGKPELSRCLEICAEADSPIVRDCVALIREIEGGRKELGKIEDIHALRQRFIALDIDPDRAEARLAEEKAAEDLAERELAEKLETAHRIVDSASVEEILERAWDFVGDNAVQEVLYEHVEHERKDLAPVFKRWAFRVEGRHSRNGKSFGFELDETHEALGASAGALLPWILSHPDTSLLPFAAMTGDPRVGAIAVEMLGVREKYNHGLTAAVRTIRTLGLRDQGPRLAAMLDEFRYDPDDYMTEISNGDLMVELIDTCAALGVTEALPVIKGLSKASRDKLQPRAVKALGALGGADSVDLLVPHLDTNWSRPAMFALALGGGARARDILEARVGKVVGSPAKLCFDRVMLQASRLACGDTVVWSAIEFATTLVEAKKFEDLELRQTICRMLPHHPDGDWARHQAIALLDYELPEVRHAAIEALREMGDDPQITYLDRGYVEWLYEQGGVAALNEALVNPFAVFKENVLRLAADLGKGAEILGGALDYVRRLARFEHYTNGYVKFEHDKMEYALDALIAFNLPEADTVLFSLSKSFCALYRACDVFKYDHGEIGARLATMDMAESAADEVASWSVESLGETPWLYGGSINSIAWSPDATRVAVAGSAGVRIFAPSGVLLGEAETMRGQWIYDVAWSPDSQNLAAGAHAGHLHLLDRDANLVRKLVGHSGVPTGVRKLRFSPDGSRLASVSDDRTMRVWQTDSGEALMVHNDTSDVNGIDWIDADCAVFVTDQKVKTISVPDGEVLAEISAAGVAEVRVGPDTRVYVGAGTIRVFDRDLVEDKTASMTQGKVARMSFHHDLLVASSWEGESISAWSLEDGSRLDWSGAEGATLYGADLSPDGTHYIAGGSDGVLYRFSETGELIEPDAVFHTGELESVCIESGSLWSVSSEAVIAWDVENRSRREIYRSEHRMNAVAPTETHVYIASGEAIIAFERGASEPLWTVECRRSECLFVHDRWVVAANYDALTWYDGKTGIIDHTTAAFADSFIFYAVRLDEHRVAVAGYDDTRLFIWNLGTREHEGEMILPAGEKNSIRAVGRGPDRVVVSRWDGAVDMFDIAGSHTLQARLSGAHAPVAVTPDGEILAAGCIGVLCSAEKK